MNKAQGLVADMEKLNMNNTLPESREKSPIDFLIGLAMIVFLALLAFWVLKIVLGIVMTFLPLLGIGFAVGGGWWYLKAKNDHFRLRGMTLFAMGLGMLLLTMIF